MPQRCPYCNATNRDTARFCAHCAQPLRRECPSCGADNLVRSRFCSNCGKPLVQELRCPQCGCVNPAGARFCNGCATPLQVMSQVPITPLLFPAPAAVLPAATLSPGTGMLPPRSVLAGRYVILRCVGRGGMGAVYQASDAHIPGKTWAVKEISEAALTDPLERQQAREAFQKEALMLASLDHPNLPRITDYFAEGGKQYLVMDFIEGETLLERLEHAQGGLLPVEEVIQWADQLCAVLDYLHTRKPPVIFRDLKPANVMVTREGVVKLIDFGIARLFKAGKRTDTTFIGTEGYSPREQYGRGQTDARSDIYALGATLHHLLTGVDPADRPFHFEDVRRLNRKVPTHVADAIAKALADDPADRWQSAAEMRAALTAQPFQPLPMVSPTAQPAMVAAQAGAAVYPTPVPPIPRLNFWRGLGLTLLGAVLYGVSSLLFGWSLGQVRFPLHLLAFVPPLFGVLFGPWVGGFAGALGALALFALEPMFPHRHYSELWRYVLPMAMGAFVLGLLPGRLVKDARRWWSVTGAGVLASVACALCTAMALGIFYGFGKEFGGNIVSIVSWTSPVNVLLLPLFARLLAEPVRRRGLYWWDLH